MIRLSTAILPAALLIAPATISAQSSGFADLAAIDAQVAAFTGAAIGSPGGARQPVDRRMRLAACGGPLDLSWHGRGGDMVRVQCLADGGWRIFVPVAAVRGAATGIADTADAAPVVIERGQVLTITVAGRGFSVSQQGEALDDGAIGDWIRIRPQGNREVVRARIETPQRAVIPLG